MVEYMVMSTRHTLEEPTVVDTLGTPVHSPAGALGSPGGSLVEDRGKAEQNQSRSLLSADRLNVDHDDAPLHLRSMGNIFGEATVPGFAVQNVEREKGALHAVGADELSSLE
jgi:hypothetical protein